MAKIIPINGYKKQRRENYSPDEKKSKKTSSKGSGEYSEKEAAQCLCKASMTLSEITK